MSRVNGQLVTCNRCGKTIFLKCTGEGVEDGGFTRWNSFEAFPEGWYKISNFGDLCPDCFIEYEKFKKEFLKFTEANVCNT